MTVARFRPKSRMVKILGEHLIRDNTVGLMELVKNGYDADATEVIVSIENLKDTTRTMVTVEDNGIGMTMPVIVGPWFEPAHEQKERQKELGARTPLGRMPLGEKGVGRFAAQRIGKVLELVSRPVDDPQEYFLTIDWTRFESDDSYLDEIEIPVQSRPPIVFKGNSHGTRLTMVGAREKWSNRDLQRFQASLIRLLSPKRLVGAFDVLLRCPELPEVENLDHHDVVERYQFRIDGIVDENGELAYEYRSREPDGTVETETRKRNIWAEVNPDGWTERKPLCGQFYVQISAWLRGAGNLSLYDVTREQLQTLGGVSIYRDGFRILPYGDEGDDWLGLDLRRVNVPGERFSNNQIIGTIDVNQVENKQLIDKTNREGLQENQAYVDFRSLVLASVDILEQESLERRKKSKKPLPSKKELVTTIEDLKDELRQIKESAPIHVPVEPQSDELDQAGEPQHENGLAEPEMVLVAAEKLDLLQKKATYVNEAVAELYTEQEELREAWLHLAGIGLAAERFAHEFDRLVDRLGQVFQQIKSKLGDTDSSVRHLDLFVNALRNEVRLMGTLRYVRRAQRAESVSVKHVIELVVDAHAEAAKEARVDLELILENDFVIRISEASIAQVFDNIIDNAMYWIRQKLETDNRRLRIELLPDRQCVLISNNGPSIPPNIRQHLFRMPFVTAKQNGRGLGMHIAAEIMKKVGGSISLVSADDNRVLDGAAFRIEFGEPSTR